MRSLVAEVSVAGLLAALCMAAPVYAQLIDTSVFGPTFSIALSPQYPQPGQSVHLTLNSSADISGDPIVWRANGNVIAQGIGIDSADVVAGNLGTQTQIEADAQMPDGSVQSAQATIAPTEIDLLVESDSYTPPFYRGRALPSADSDVIARAITRFENADGTLVPDSQIIYTWKFNGEVLGSQSGRGKSSIVIPIQHLFTANQITIDAASADGTRSGEASVTAPSVNPIIDLYEDHPLYGILYNNAIIGTGSIPEQEMSFAAVPYFAEANGVTDPQLSYAWSVNNTPIPTSTTTPNEITIDASNSTGIAQVALELTRAGNFFLDAKGSWQINFSSGTSQNPFTAGQ